MDYEEFTVQGFKHIGTGPQDYGQGIVRVSSRAKKELKQLEKLSRNDLIRVQRKDGQWMTGLLRYFDSNEARLLCIEYDDRLELGVNKGENAELSIRKAYRAERALFFWHHPNPIVRIEFKLAVALGLLCVLLGFLAGLVVP